MNFILKMQYLLLIFLFSLKHQLVWGQNRIIGGQEINIERVPYMLRLAVAYGNGHQGSCGASIISKNWGLTAAHCFDKATENSTVSVTAGTDDLKNQKKTAKTYQVPHYYIHERYKKQLLAYDIAVFRITPPITFNKATKAVRLPIEGKPLYPKWAVIAGWGHTHPNGTSQKKLRYVRIPKFPTATCTMMYKEKQIPVEKGQMCYGFYNKTVIQDKCQGDSGGPLVAKSVEIGLVSYGYECGTHGLPGVYTDILYFRDWIRKKTGI